MRGRKERRNLPGYFAYNISFIRGEKKREKREGIEQIEGPKFPADPYLNVCSMNRTS